MGTVKRHERLATLHCARGWLQCVRNGGSVLTEKLSKSFVKKTTYFVHIFFVLYRTRYVTNLPQCNIGIFSALYPGRTQIIAQLLMHKPALLFTILLFFMFYYCIFLLCYYLILLACIIPFDVLVYKLIF